ncbi:MAG TPA: histidine kinase [Planctomycetaceae bacterium]|nr:histidine kinase [Planctomycetaceae bacterium]
MSIEDDELLTEFVVESQEHLEDVESQLLTLEEQQDDVDVALVNKVFRAVHSIKGAAGFLGLETLETLAHREEAVLDRLRNNEIVPTSHVVNTLLSATDQLKELLAAVETSNEQDVSAHITALEEVLAASSGDQTTTSSETQSAPSQTASIEPATTTETDTDNSEEHKETPAPSSPAPSGISQEAVCEFLVESHDNLEQVERDLVALEREPGNEELINGIFRSIHTIKGSSGFLAYNVLEKVTHAGENLLGNVRSGQMQLNETISSALFSMIDQVRALLTTIEQSGSDHGVDCSGILEELHAVNNGEAPKTNHNSPAFETLVEEDGEDAKSGDSSTPSSPAAVSANATTTSAAEGETPATPRLADAKTSVAETGKAIASKADSAAGTSQVQPAGKKATGGSAEVRSAADSTIRVDVALLDKLMTRVGELVLARNQIMQYTNTSGDNDFTSTGQRLNLITTELQESVMKTRMQPIGNVWSKFPRIVRDLATTCGKQVRIEMEGRETELDKTIIEAIKDPLTHLVRNSVDHGIEAPEVRVANDKTAEGCLLLRAFHEGGQVNIEICDDGAGLKLDRIRQKAVDKGLISPEQAERMQDRDVGQLIFMPGFSTAEKVSNVSGRGVGMDVVKTNIEKIGGTVDIQSDQGNGTSIKIKIPLTLAIIPALIVSNDGNRFAIPQVNLLELVRLDGAQATESIEWIQGAPVYRLRGRLLPLVYLRKVLRTEEGKAEDDSINIVVLRADDRQFGLVVDRIMDTEEIVVKPLSQQLKSIPVYAGATIMGDGKVALILDVLGIAHKAQVISKARDRGHLEQLELNKECGAELQTYLILGTDNNRRLTLPISQVARLEQISADSVEMANRSEVVQYRGEILPLIRLADVLGFRSQGAAETDLLNVVVYTENDRSYGIVVDYIVDIVETAVEISRGAVSGRGLLGSAVIQNCVTDVVDLPAVIRQVDASL